MKIGLVRPHSEEDGPSFDIFLRAVVATTIFFKFMPAHFCQRQSKVELTICRDNAAVKYLHIQQRSLAQIWRWRVPQIQALHIGFNTAHRSLIKCHFILCFMYQKHIFLCKTIYVLLDLEQTKLVSGGSYHVEKWSWCLWTKEATAGQGWQ